MVVLLIANSYAYTDEELLSNKNVNSAIKKYFNDEDYKIVHLEYSRKIINESNAVSLEITIKYDYLNNTGLIVYDFLPKDLVNNAEDDILNVNTEHYVAGKNEVVHYIRNFDKDIKITYIILSNNGNPEFISPPAFFIRYDKDRMLADEFTKVYNTNFLIYLFILLGLIIIIKLIVELISLKK